MTGEDGDRFKADELNFVDVTRADAVAIRLIAHDVAHKVSVFQFVPGERRIGIAELR